MPGKQTAVITAKIDQETHDLFKKHWESKGLNKNSGLKELITSYLSQFTLTKETFNKIGLIVISEELKQPLILWIDETDPLSIKQLGAVDKWGFETSILKPIKEFTAEANTLNYLTDKLREENPNINIDNVYYGIFRVNNYLDEFQDGEYRSLENKDKHTSLNYFIKPTGAIVHIATEFDFNFEDLTAKILKPGELTATFSYLKENDPASIGIIDAYENSFSQYNINVNDYEGNELKTIEQSIINNIDNRRNLIDYHFSEIESLETKLNEIQEKLYN